MKINQQLLKINRNFIICFIVSAIVSASLAQVMKYYENHIITTITIIIGYIVFFGIFSMLFYFENKSRYKMMNSEAIKKEIIKLLTSFSIGEIFYLIARWSSFFYFLEISWEPFMASLTSEILATIIYMIIVSVFLKASKTF